jgi:hypothetical protein
MLRKDYSASARPSSHREIHLASFGRIPDYCSCSYFKVRRPWLNRIAARCACDAELIRDAMHDEFLGVHFMACGALPGVMNK